MSKMISVIVPVYNVEKYLNRCVESILQQDVPLELILIDDGSTDQSGAICDSYCGDERVRVIHQENKGVSAARNAGIAVASGDYVLFADSDDWIAENALSKMLAAGDGADMIVCGAYNARQVADEQYEFTNRVSWEGQSQPFAVKDKYCEIFNKNVTLWNKLVRRSVIADIRFQTNMTYGEDCDFLCRLLDNVETAVIVPEKLYYYFINRQGSVVASKIDERSLELLDNAKIIYDYLVARGQSSSGIRRIYIAAGEVLSKIPLTADDLRKNKGYIAYARKTMRYPKLADRIRFYTDTDIHRGIKVAYVRILCNPWHMHFRLLRRKISRGHR